MKFSVIIPARVINDNLKETISHLKKVIYYDFEVILILDEFIKVNFGPKETRFTVISSGAVSPGEKRNLGAQTATGDVLAFLDDDAYPDQRWLRSAANIFEENPALYALGGPAITPMNTTFEERVTGYLLESTLASGSTTYRHKPEKRREIDDYPSVNLFVKKEAFLAVGGFNNKYWPGEDTKLCLDLVNKYKHKFLYDPAPLVYHHRRRLFKPFIEQISRYGMHRGYFARVFPKNSRKLVYFIPSLFDLWLVSGLIMSILIENVFIFYLLILFLYFTLVFTEAQKVSMVEKDFKTFRFIFFGIILTNLSYGFNFLKGFLFKTRMKLRAYDEKTGNYLGG